LLHARQSTPGGAKPSCLIQHGHPVLNPRRPGEDFEEAVRHAEADACP
jgi:hypothetical protein